MSVPTTPGRPAPAVSDRPGPPVVGLIGGLVGCLAVVSIALVTGWGWSGVAASAALVPASAAAAFDLRTRRLPDVLVALTAATALFVTVVVRGGAGFVMALAGAVCLAVPLLVVHAASPGAMGFGDVKLGGSLGAGLGVVSPDAITVLQLCLVTLALASAVGLAVAVSTRRRDVAFAPALVAGTAVTMMSAERLGGAPLSWQ